MARDRRRASAAGSALTVPQLLNEAQRGAASAHVRYAKMLWELALSDANGARDQLLAAIKWFATVAEPTVYQSRLLNFMGTFAAEATSDDRVTFVECLLVPLVDLTYARDVTARWRFCQLLHALVGNLPPEAELSDDVLDSFQEAMEDRLEDAKPTIRAVAVRALARLPNPGTDEDFSCCPLTQAMLDMLAAEKSKAVRKAVLATLPCSTFTRKVFMERTRDEADDVRKMAYMALAERVPLAAMPVDDAAALLRGGLNDRAAPVREAVAGRLVAAWLEEVEGEPLRLVHALGVQAHPEECELVLRTLLDRGVASAVHLGRMAESEGLGLRADFGQEGVLMGPASALFWRVVCEWLSSDANSKGVSAANKVGAAANIDAAAAGERLEALESALPATVADMASVIAKHAAAGARYRFSTGQLMQLAAACMDFADASGRSAASSMLRGLLADAPAGDDAEEAAAWEEAWHSDTWLAALTLFLRKVYGSAAELSDALLGVIGSIHRSGGFAAEAGPAQVPEQAWLHALGVAGLLLGQLRSAWPALNVSGTFGLRDLLDSIIQPGQLHRSAKVRREAVRCLGLYCGLDGIPTSPAGHLLVLRQVLLTHSETSAVKAVAVQALADAALARGIKDVDGLVEPEMAARYRLGLNNERPLSRDVELQQHKPLLGLLLEMLREWTERFEAAAAGGDRKQASRRSRSSEGLEQQAVLGAALVQALARLVRCHLYWVQRQEREGQLLALEDLEVIEVLVDLVVLYFNPAIEAATLVCQALPVFFQHYAELTPEHQQYLATAFLAAARTAAAEDKASGRRVTAATCTSAKVMGFLAQLLMTPYRGEHNSKQEAVGHEMLVDLVLREAVVCSSPPYLPEVPKPHLAALCRVAAALEVFPVGEVEDGATVRTLKQLARQAWAQVPDRAMRKDLDTLLERLSSRAAQFGLAVDPFTPEEVDGLLETLLDYDSSGLLADYPLPFDAVEVPQGGAAPPAAARAARAPAKGKTPAKARGGRRQQAGSSSDDDEGSDSAPQMPESSDDEGEEGDGGAHRTPARAPASRLQPGRAARSTRKPIVDADSSSSSSEGEGEEGDSDGEEGDGLALLENSPAVVRNSKARRCSADSVSALRQALQENRIS
ncbi:Condensin complex subunit 3 [Chlorella vulgaris]